MKLRASGATRLSFEGGEPYMKTPDLIKEAMARAIQENKTRYAPSSGIPELRAANRCQASREERIPAADKDVMF